MFSEFEKVYKNEKIEGNREGKTYATSEAFYTNQFKSYQRSNSYTRNPRSNSTDGRGRPDDRGRSFDRSRNRSRNFSKSRDRSYNRTPGKGNDEIVKNLQNKMLQQDKRIQNLEDILKEKKIIETNLCVVDDNKMNMHEESHGEKISSRVE